MPGVYAASKAKHSHWWRALRAAGVPISAAWIDAELNEAGADEPTTDAWREHWDKCVAEAAEADVCLFVCNEGETACGALIEAGAALAAGRQVFVVSPYDWTFANHPRCRVFTSLEAAIVAIMAMQEGERARARSNIGNIGDIDPCTRAGLR
jgi:hypothetical protein